jgi:aminomethyltransferase
MIPYAGWDMPVEYSGISNEHLAVRTRAGVFDVSHMGEIEIAGKNALAAVQLISSNDASLLQPGQAQYAALTTPGGTFVDDMLVYRMAPSHFMLVVNAANTAKAFTWIHEQIKTVGDVAAIDSSSRYALIAVQGPAAREVLQPLTAVELGDIGYYRFGYGEVAAGRATISRTGYTGEDGFEIFVPPNVADRVWQAILDSGRSADVIPCGLGARDTLRLEAALRLYGNDIDETTTVLEAGLGWTIGWKKGNFIGRDRLVEQKERGTARKLVGFEMIDRAIARQGYSVVSGGRSVVSGGRAIGVVTSGTQTPFLKKAIGMAYVPTELHAVDTEIEVDIRGRVSKARIVCLPFYSRTGV